MCYFLLFHLCLQLGFYLDSEDESREFLEIESFFHLQEKVFRIFNFLVAAAYGILY